MALSESLSEGKRLIRETFYLFIATKYMKKALKEIKKGNTELGKALHLVGLEYERLAKSQPTERG